LSIEINISNYESYLLSYIDGELNEAEMAALELFLQKHPQFKQELELLEGVRVVPDEMIVFDNKASLYRTISADVVDYEELMLGHIDGELTAAGKGIYQHLDNNTDDVVNTLVSKIDSMEQKEFGENVFTDYNSYFQYFLGICLALLLIEFFIPEVRFKRTAETSAA
jgi:hypothetical protein